jgi:hypothetical protein
MSKNEFAFYTIFALFPLISAPLAVSLFALTAYLRRRNKRHKGLFIAASILTSLLLIYIIIFIAIGFVGVGPGIADADIRLS